MSFSGQQDAATALQQLGFSASEAEVYVCLLQESPATGYRVASRIGKAVANTYKALRSLAQKGAVIIEEGPARLCRAVPPDELLSRLAREFETQREQAQEALTQLQTVRDDSGVYRLETVAQVLERGRAMLAEARQVVLLVGFPRPLAALAPALTEAAARGVDVLVKGYEEAPPMPGVEFMLSNHAAQIQRDWPGEELHIVVDGLQSLAALLAGDELIQAIWSASPFIGLVHHNGLATEFVMTSLIRALRNRPPDPELSAIVERLRHPAATLGARRLRER